MDLGAIAHNVRLIRSRVGQRRLLAVVKANAYGHGALAVARLLETVGDHGADHLAVATVEEGLELREGGIRMPILVVGATEREQVPLMRPASLIPTVYGLSSLAAILEEAERSGAPLPFHLKMDTGMGRLGLLPSQLPGALERLAAARPPARIEGIFTTLAAADDPADPHTARQVGLFLEAIAAVRQAGFEPGMIHAANSGGVIDHAPSWLNTVRPGIMLYGIHPSGRSTRLDLRPALSFHTRVLLLKAVPAGTPLGYGHAFVTSRDSIIGTIPVGYADGLPRALSPGGGALVRGHHAPFAGRISMDHSMLDLTGIPGAAEGDDVILIGTQGSRAITADAYASGSGTIPYEALCRLGPRVPIVHTKTL